MEEKRKTITQEAGELCFFGSSTDGLILHPRFRAFID
jgi:hypothetical protein